MSRYYRENPEKYKRTPEQEAKRNARRRERYANEAAHRESIKAQVKAWNLANPEKRKAGRLKAFGIQMSDFEDLMAIQNRLCAICGLGEDGDKNHFPLVDHNHRTGMVRGLLCMNCNQGIGKFHDDPNLLMAAAVYLSSRG